MLKILRFYLTSNEALNTSEWFNCALVHIGVSVSERANAHAYICICVCVCVFVRWFYFKVSSDTGSIGASSFDGHRRLRSHRSPAATTTTAYDAQNVQDASRVVLVAPWPKLYGRLKAGHGGCQSLHHGGLLFNREIRILHMRGERDLFSSPGKLPLVCSARSLFMQINKTGRSNAFF